ncbi:hypothetical protein [Plasmodium yoelii yoelii]|uniref:Cilia- and flagella-associated protein 61 N-terminal domain-containing protein n=1 Tax=Plasmodium yoelii yoelii TaxID=73239 RepID=Q7RQX3_PLAYO|nr:hypothetical protein [Plasmodium yoelii yoelii]
MLLKEKWGGEINKHLLYSLNDIDTRIETREDNKNKESYLLENKENLNNHFYELNYSNIFNTIQYSSVCISIFINENETKDNIIGIVSIDYDLLPNFEDVENESYCSDNKIENINYFVNELNLDDLYYYLSLYIKKYNIVSNLNNNNTLIINLIITDNTNYYYYDDLFFYLFNEFEDISFILFFLKNENNIEKIDILKKGILIDLDSLTYDNVKNISRSNLKYNKIFLINKNMFVNKIYIRSTTSSDIYDLHELFKKYVYQPEYKPNNYLMYDIIENKTENDILISILNSREKIIGFVWLKKNIDINILTYILQYPHNWCVYVLEMRSRQA